MIDEECKRPEPEAFLERIKAKEEGKNCGKLTIYFGAAPGVGKTYTMLYDAKLLKAEGKDIVIGYIEPHRRPETEALLENHEMIPPRTIKYKGVCLKEMDTDAILSRKPQIVLLDELAHTNAPGSRHIKRYQDAEEILNAGIDVWTTLNVQHLESLNDQIFKIAKIHVQETLPDTMFQSAYDIRLIDLSTEKLRKRLKEGKVYVKDMAKQAISHFFQKENLLALREITLRLMLNRVNEDMRQYMKAHPIEGPWPTKERILVGVSASPDAEQLVRSAFTLASHNDGELIALYIETDKSTSLSEKERQWLMDAMEMAKKLGAQTVWLKGDNISEEIANYAKNHNITKIVIGKPHIRLFPSLAQKIVRSTKDIDLCLFAGGETDSDIKKKIRIPVHPFSYGLSALAVVIFSLIGFFLQENLGEINLLFLLFLPVILSALFLGRGASIFAAVVSIIIFDYLFVQPPFSFAISDLKYFISFGVYIAIVVIISNLTSKLRKRVKQLQQSEAKSTMLYGLSRDLVIAWDVDQVILTLIKHITQLYPCEVAAFLPVNSKLSTRTATSGWQDNQKGMGVANWVFTNGKSAGQGTSTLPQAGAFYLPIKTTDKVIGVIGFHFKNPQQVFTPENQDMLETITHLGALSIEGIGG